MKRKVPIPNRVEEKNTLKHWVALQFYDEAQYAEVIAWIKENVPPNDRYTPKWCEDDWTHDYDSIKLTFGFCHDENAMALKLAFSHLVIRNSE